MGQFLARQPGETPNFPGPWGRPTGGVPTRPGPRGIEELRGTGGAGFDRRDGGGGRRRETPDFQNIRLM